VLKKFQSVKKAELREIKMDTERIKSKNDFERSAHGQGAIDVAQKVLKPCIYKRR